MTLIPGPAQGLARTLRLVVRERERDGVPDDHHALDRVAADVGYLSKVRAALDALSRRRPPDIAAEAIIEGRFVEAADVLAEMGRMVAAARVRDGGPTDP